MTVIIGLILLVAAVIATAAGFFANNGAANELPSDSFAVFGYHVTGTTGALLLHGVALGALAMLGLALILAGARRSSRRGHAARRDLQRSERRVAAAGQEGVADHTRGAVAATSSNGSRHGPRTWRHPLGSRA
ncbi:hypothetical protein IHQ52_17870 [Gordonia amicalis]|uniref:hypothetical protein n=1 Tax=Gordonia amicalis TaxID=89053 RepID=UPI001EDE3531|nr:hypothetical protein [Gordonia amicalis]UKO90864.1 hypothetical protein IHQ52_17870 [Gordonia amicalis]